MRRRLVVLFGLTLAFLTVAGPALACGGLLSPNGSVNLLRTTTLAAYHEGVEHYITSFRFVGGGGAKFGSIIPLPGVPSDVIKGGDWTLQRLLREVRPPIPAPEGAFLASADQAGRAQELMNVSIDALDITVLKGGGAEVARWATDKGFQLSPDSPEVLDFYATRSPIFLAARFDSKRAADQGLAEGDGTPIHVIMPTPNPWVPLRILGLGKEPGELIEADVFLLTDRAPAMLPAAVGVKAGELIPRTSGMRLGRSEWASELLLSDLRSDRGMEWLPAKNMWLTFLEIDTPAGLLKYDLAIDASGAAQPSYVAAGLTDALQRAREIVSGDAVSWVAMLALGSVGGAVAGYLVRQRMAASH